MLAAIGILPCLAVFALNLSAVHGHYAYSVPVAESTVDFYTISYMVAEKDDYNYDVHFFPPRGVYVREYPAAENRTPGEFTISGITQADGETIKIDFADNNYTITTPKVACRTDPFPCFHTPRRLG